ncbi:hypothetical protein ACLKA6_019422 [Drosophila palustris]
MSAGSSSTSKSVSTPATTTTIAVNLRKSHSTPALKFVGNSNNSSNNIAIEDDSSNNFKTQLKPAMEASNIATKDVAVVGHLMRQQQQQQQHHHPPQHEQLQRINGNDGNKCNTTIDATKPATPESLRFGCTHYKRRAMFVVSLDTLH